MNIPFNHIEDLETGDCGTGLIIYQIQPLCHPDDIHALLLPLAEQIEMNFKPNGTELTFDEEEDNNNDLVL